MPVARKVWLPIRVLMPAGWDALTDYGVRMAVDLRADWEMAEDAPEGAPIEVRRFVVLQRVVGRDAENVP